MTTATTMPSAAPVIDVARVRRRLQDREQEHRGLEALRGAPRGTPSGSAPTRIRSRAPRPRSASRSPLSSRACARIHSTIQLTNATATRPTIVSRPSCWRCGRLRSAIRSAMPPARHSATPRPTPVHSAHISRLRPLRFRNAATIPTMSDASRPFSQSDDEGGQHREAPEASGATSPKLRAPLVPVKLPRHRPGPAGSLIPAEFGPIGDEMVARSRRSVVAAATTALVVIAVVLVRGDRPQRGRRRHQRARTRLARDDARRRSTPRAGPAVVTITARLTDEQSPSIGGTAPLSRVILTGPAGQQQAIAYLSQAQRVSGTPTDGIYRSSRDHPVARGTRSVERVGGSRRHLRQHADA